MSDGSRRAPTVFCEVRKGQVAQMGIDRFVRFMETSDSLGPDARYDDLASHRATIDIAVQRMGSEQRVVGRGAATPINVWVVNKLLFQIRAQTSWESSRELRDCGVVSPKP